MDKIIFEDWVRKPSILKTLIFIDNKQNLYCSMLPRKIGMTYRTMFTSLKFLQDNNFIILKKKKKKGREKFIHLTEKGKEIVSKLNELNILFKQI